ncbi:SIMPL domain-containing protein [Candidatus Peribacteria bacterium]|nr:SIMPL domain-containing protein [Candidatus Peribacteria bacterium]
MRKNYEIIGYSENTQNIISYTLSRSISAETQDLSQAEKLSKEMNTAAAKNDIALSNSYTSYQYTDLEDLRPKLLKLATEDARKKAEAMASSTGRKIGNLRAGRMGVVQVLAKNSIEISDYGSYDLSSPEKDIFVTVNVTFALK